MPSKGKEGTSTRSTKKSERASAVAENYLLSMYGFWEDHKKPTLAVLAESLKRMPESEGLGTSLPSVTGMVRRMQKENLLEVNSQKEILLTREGFRRAEDITKRHRLAELMVVDLFDIGLPRAHLEAHRLEHAISSELMQNIIKRLGDPALSPFGRPIPGLFDAKNAPEVVSLERTTEGSTYLIQRIPEDNEDLVQFLVDADILPGNTVTIEEVATYRGVITIASNKTTTSIGFEPASQVWVTDVTIAG